MSSDCADGALNILANANTVGSFTATLVAADTISGGDGDDFLDGGPGSDSLRGDGGRDTCVGWELRASSCEP